MSIYTINPKAVQALAEQIRALGTTESTFTPLQTEVLTQLLISLYRPPLLNPGEVTSHQEVARRQQLIDESDFTEMYQHIADDMDSKKNDECATNIRDLCAVFVERAYRTIREKFDGSIAALVEPDETIRQTEYKRALHELNGRVHVLRAAFPEINFNEVMRDSIAEAILGAEELQQLLRDKDVDVRQNLEQRIDEATTTALKEMRGGEDLLDSEFKNRPS